MRVPSTSLSSLLAVRVLLLLAAAAAAVVVVVVDGFSPARPIVAAMTSRQRVFTMPSTLPPPPPPCRSFSRLKMSMSAATAATTSSPSVGPRLAIREDFPGLQQIHSNPDIYVIENFLDESSCRDLIEQAQRKGLEQSPVAYAGWTEDFRDLVELAAKGPVAWLAIAGGWSQTKDAMPGAAASSQIDLIGHMVQNFLVLMIVAIAGIGLFTKSRGDQLQNLRTSTSTTLDDMAASGGGSGTGGGGGGGGPVTFVRRATDLFTAGAYSPTTIAKQEEAAHFEAPTVIRYEAGQVLAPHYDANRSAATEDANRGGQTLATLLVYLNDVQQGGLTRFGKLASPSSSSSSSSRNDYYNKQVDATQDKLSIRPKRGDALLFFPADVNGNFDERTEHEGCPAVDEKFIARIWRHQNRVPPPFGLTDDALKIV